MASTKPVLSPPISRADHAGHTEYQSGHYRGDDRQQRRNNHLMLCPFRRNLYATGVIGFRFSCQDTRYFAELAAYFFYHMSGGASYGVHRQPAEHKGHHRPQEHARQYFRIHQRHIVVDHKVGERCFRYLHRTSVGKRQDGFSQAQQADLDLFYIRRQQRQSRQGGRADGESFTGGGCGVPSESRASVRLRTSLPRPDISAFPPALSAIGP